MKLLVLGATGGIGIEIVEQALERGHAVTAFVRSSQRLKSFVGKINIVEGNPLDSREVARVLEGHDAVISAFGPRVPIARADAHLLRDFAAHQQVFPAAFKNRFDRRDVFTCTDEVSGGAPPQK